MERRRAIRATGPRSEAVAWSGPGRRSEPAPVDQRAKNRASPRSENDRVQNPRTETPGARRALRRQRGKDAARALVVEAAAAIFARRGYHGATIEQVAAQAGYSPAAIYKIFRNKEELFSTLWTAMADRLQGIFVDSAAVSLPFELRLRWTVTRVGQLVEQSPDMLVAFLAQRPHVVRQGGSPLERAAAEHYDAYHQAVVGFVRAGVEEGILRAVSVDDLALLFIGLMQSFAYSWVVAPESFDLPSSTDRFIDLFLNGAENRRRDSG